MNLLSQLLFFVKHLFVCNFFKSIMSVSLANFKNWIFIFLTKFLLLLSVVFCTVSVSNLGKHFLTRAYCQTQTTVFNIPPLPWDFPRFSSWNNISHLINKDKVICVHAFIGCQYILPGPVHIENIVSIGGKKNKRLFDF